MVTQRVARDIVRQWEKMQTVYIPLREIRFSRMLDLLDEWLPPKFHALDLGSGPGSLSVRLLERFPGARCTAVDCDPLQLALGRSCYGTMGGRLNWVDADLRRKDWPGWLPTRKFDAVISTTAFHWLTPSQLERTYRRACELLRRRGILLNGDRATVGPSSKRLKKVSFDTYMYVKRSHGLRDPSQPWSTWWNEVLRVEELRPLVEERNRRFPRHSESDLPASAHLRYLKKAGFAEEEVVWRDLSDCIIAAIKT